MNRIKEIRISKGIRQIELAQTLGISQSTLSTWENGRYEPDIAAINKLADYFGVSSDYLLGRDIEFAMFGGENIPIDDELMQDVASFAAHIKAQKNKASSKDEAEVEELMKLYAKLTPENRTIHLAAAKGLAQDK